MIVAIDNYLEEIGKQIQIEKLPDWYKCVKDAMKELQMYPNGRIQPKIFESSIESIIFQVEEYATAYIMENSDKEKVLCNEKYIRLNNLFFSFVAECCNSGFMCEERKKYWLDFYSACVDDAEKTERTEQYKSCYTYLDNIQKEGKTHKKLNIYKKMFDALNSYLLNTKKNESNWLMFWGVLEMSNNYEPILWCGNIYELSYLLAELKGVEWKTTCKDFKVKNTKNEFVIKKPTDYAGAFSRFKVTKKYEKSKIKDIVKQYKKELI